MADETSFSHREILGILSGILLGMFLAALDQTIVATALPTIAAELQGAEHLSWIVAAYLLTSTASTPIYGKLSDLYGRRALLRVAILVFVVASALCGLAQSMPQLILARALQGLGGGGLITMAQATIADVIPPRERGRYQAYFSGTWAVASVGGPVLGGFFADYLTWRWVFWVNLPLGVAALALGHFALRRLPARRLRRPIDYLGAALMVGAVGALLLVTAWGGTALPWSSPTVLALAAAGIVLLAFFVLQELRAAEPILPPRLFMSPVVRVASATSFLASMAMFGATILLPVFLQLVGGASASHSGMLVIPLMGGTVVGAYTAGQMMRRTGRYKRLPLIGLSAATIAFLLLAGVTAATPRALSTLYMAALGAGIGLMMPVMLVAVQNAADARDIGIATSSIAFFRSLGGSFGAAGLWTVLLVALGRLLPAGAGLEAGMLRSGPDALAALPPDLRAAAAGALTGAFHAVFLAGAAIAALSLLVALFLPERPLRTGPAPAAPGRPAAAPLPSSGRPG
jgi:EmrB/QacA subfamily drug resistance transporter